MEYIDLRSDTVTKPTGEMREAMARADVGDDVYGEDPTINRLQERAAELLGKEAALFVPSGTMGNQICIHIHTRPGQEVITESRSHIFNYEMAAMAALSGTLARPVYGKDGILEWDDIEPVIVSSGVSYRAHTGLVTLENTHNMAGGTVIPLERMENICARAHEAGLHVHLDGARIFNAGHALDCSAAQIARPFDSVMFCLSKGLSAPVGSLITGSRTFINRAVNIRKMFGGGMRQAGVLAAAGLVALEKMTSRLIEDHYNARLLARGLSTIPGVRIDSEKARTNIVIFNIEETGIHSATFCSEVKKQGVLLSGIGKYVVRIVTHNDVSPRDCSIALEVIRNVVANADTPA